MDAKEERARILGTHECAQTLSDNSSSSRSSVEACAMSGGAGDKYGLGKTVFSLSPMLLRWFH